MNLRTRRRPNKKQNTRNYNTDIVNKYFMKILEEFMYITYLGFRKRQVKNDITEVYLFLVKKFSAN